jgi:hypothetical protein
MRLGFVLPVFLFRRLLVRELHGGTLHLDSFVGGPDARGKQARKNGFLSCPPDSRSRLQVHVPQGIAAVSPWVPSAPFRFFSRLMLSIPTSEPAGRRRLADRGGPRSLESARCDQPTKSHRQGPALLATSLQATVLPKNARTHPANGSPTVNYGADRGCSSTFRKKIPPILRAAIDADLVSARERRCTWREGISRAWHGHPARGGDR